MISNGRKQSRITGTTAGWASEGLAFGSKKPVDGSLAAVRTLPFPTRVPARQSSRQREDQRAPAFVFPTTRIGICRHRREACGTRVVRFPFRGIQRTAAMRAWKTPHGNRQVGHAPIILSASFISCCETRRCVCRHASKDCVQDEQQRSPRLYQWLVSPLLASTVAYRDLNPQVRAAPCGVPGQWCPRSPAFVIGVRQVFFIAAPPRIPCHRAIVCWSTGGEHA